MCCIGEIILQRPILRKSYSKCSVLDLAYESIFLAYSQPASVFVLALNVVCVVLYILWQPIFEPRKLGDNRTHNNRTLCQVRKTTKFWVWIWIRSRGGHQVLWIPKLFNGRYRVFQGSLYPLYSSWRHRITSTGKVGFTTKPLKSTTLVGCRWLYVTR